MDVLSLQGIKGGVAEENVNILLLLKKKRGHREGRGLKDSTSYSHISALSSNRNS